MAMLDAPPGVVLGAMCSAQGGGGIIRGRSEFGTSDADGAPSRQGPMRAEHAGGDRKA